MINANHIAQIKRLKFTNKSDLKKKNNQKLQPKKDRHNDFLTAAMSEGKVPYVFIYRKLTA